MARSLSIRIGAPPATRTTLHGGGPSRGRTLSQTRARRQGLVLCGLLPARSVTRDGGAGRRGRRLRSRAPTSRGAPLADAGDGARDAAADRRLRAPLHDALDPDAGSGTAPA